MKLKLQIEEKDATYTVETNLFVIIAWERKFKRKISELSSGIGMEDLAFMAWECCKRDKVVVPVEFDSFISRLVELEVVSEEAVGPFSPAPTDVH